MLQRWLYTSSQQTKQYDNYNGSINSIYIDRVQSHSTTRQSMKRCYRYSIPFKTQLLYLDIPHKHNTHRYLSNSMERINDSITIPSLPHLLSLSSNSSITSYLSYKPYHHQHYHPSNTQHFFHSTQYLANPFPFPYLNPFYLLHLYTTQNSTHSHSPIHSLHTSPS